MCCWRRQNLDLNGWIEINRLASFGGAERNVLAIYQVQVVLEGLRRMRLATIQDLPHPEIVEDSQQAAYVIIVRVSGHHEIQARDPMASQIGLDPLPHLRYAAIDEHVLSSELEQLRVTLAYVDEVNGEILTRRYCCCRDGNQQDCEKDCLQ